MIRSSKVSIKHANVKKKHLLRVFLAEYRRVTRAFVDLIWEVKDLPSLLDKTYTSQIKTWLTARMVQCAGKQASAIVRGTRKKHEQRLWRLARLAGKSKAKLQNKINKTIPTKPNLSNIPAELDCRFIKLDLDNKTGFDGWITISCIGKKIKLVLPFNKHAQFNNWFSKSKITKGVRISESTATFMFEQEISSKTGGQILGVDIGVNHVCAGSNKFLSNADRHGHTLASILHKITRCKKGSNGFRKAASHRKNFVNWSINQLNLDNVKEVRREDIKDLRRGKKTSRFLSHWTYTDIFDKLDRFCEEQGVLVTKVNPAYTSQTCPSCQTLGKRSGNYFSCSCGYKNNADVNAAMNLAGESIVSRENVFL